MCSYWSFEELDKHYNTPILELVYRAATIHRQNHAPNEIQICHLISIKTGGCAEDCKYCAQSAYYNTPVKASPLMDKEAVLEKARSAKQRGATRVCLGMGQREIRDGVQFERVIDIIRAVNALDVEVCCTFGMLNASQAKQLKEAGAYAYNHNLDTSREFYPQIITTRTYDDRLATLDIAEQAQLQVCCGGIIGLGESQSDRIRLLQELANRNPHPGSVPINLLSKVPGTPLAEQASPSKWEVVRMIATARICMPKSIVRLTCGRLELPTEMQAFCFMAGANSIFVGEKLLTVGNPTYDQDESMFAELGLNKKVKV